ncbi:mucin-5AC-like [Anneissia japonica]|uniref:mucin-5AC-like n=1 Tax=Anneissia japonica TaxID=1529436 RepID=UPI00142570F2|nr:mucin-5AC-like [Anneissia japonica]
MSPDGAVYRRYLDDNDTPYYLPANDNDFEIKKIGLPEPIQTRFLRLKIEDFEGKEPSFRFELIGCPAKVQTTTMTTGQPSIVTTAQTTAVTTAKPSAVSTAQPPAVTTGQPSVVTTARPPTVTTGQPSIVTTGKPSVVTTGQPSGVTTAQPTVVTTVVPSVVTTGKPSVVTTAQPTAMTTGQPSVVTTAQPPAVTTGQTSVVTTSPQTAMTTGQPSVVTTQPPAVTTSVPSVVETAQPTALTTGQPSIVKTAQPTALTTGQPSVVTTAQPPAITTGVLSVVTTGKPSVVTTSQPTVITTGQPSVVTTEPQTAVTTGQPSVVTTAQPPAVTTGVPSVVKTAQPTAMTTGQPSVVTTGNPPVVTTAQPTAMTTGQPSVVTTAQPPAVTTGVPSVVKTAQPTAMTTGQPSVVTTGKPSVVKTAQPTAMTTGQPSAVTTAQQTALTTGQPPAVTTGPPSVVTTTQLPAVTTGVPSVVTTGKPSVVTTAQPTAITTGQPSVVTTAQQTAITTGQPSVVTTAQPPVVTTGVPSVVETAQPTAMTTGQPSVVTTGKPSVITTAQPTAMTTGQLSVVTTGKPTAITTGQPSVVTTAHQTAITTGQPSVVTTAQPPAITTGVPLVVTTGKPSVVTTAQPTAITTGQPSVVTTAQQTAITTGQPSVVTTAQPPAVTTGVPSVVTTGKPSVVTTAQPTAITTGQPSVVTTAQQTAITTGQPSVVTTAQPPAVTTNQPSVVTTAQPPFVTTGVPSVVETAQPTAMTTGQPSVVTTGKPTAITTGQPSVVTTAHQTTITTGQPSVVTTAHPTAITTGQQTVVTTGHPSVVTTALPTVMTTGLLSVGTTSQPPVVTTLFKMTTSAKCFSGEFTCSTNNQCVPGRVVCDQSCDCQDCSDEDMCGSTTTRKNVNAEGTTAEGTTAFESTTSMRRYTTVPTTVIIHPNVTTLPYTSQQRTSVYVPTTTILLPTTTGGPGSTILQTTGLATSVSTTSNTLHTTIGQKTTVGQQPTTGQQIITEQQTAAGEPVTTGQTTSVQPTTSQEKTTFQTFTEGQSTSINVQTTGQQIITGEAITTGQQLTSGQAIITGQQLTTGHQATTGLPTITGLPTTAGLPTITGQPTTIGLSTTAGLPTITGQPTTTGLPATTGLLTTTHEITSAEPQTTTVITTNLKTTTISVTTHKPTATVPTTPCQFAEWGLWSNCSVACGTGNRTRSRSFLNQADCQVTDDNYETEFCNDKACPTDGNWTPWGRWSDCSATCNGGSSFRYRNCTNPPPKNNGRYCDGDPIEQIVCNSTPCEEKCENGKVYDSNCTSCPYFCSDLQVGSRCAEQVCEPGCRCPDGFLEQDGHCVEQSRCDCLDENGLSYPAGFIYSDECVNCTCTDGYLMCDELDCAVDCGWSTWSEWTDCTADCGIGQTTRFRSPNNPPPANGGAECEGEEAESKKCDSGVECPTHCEYNGRIYEDGEKVTEDLCNECICKSTELVCTNNTCDGAWSPWSPWSCCNATCDGGKRLRSRSCSMPYPSNGGMPCSSDMETELEDCNTEPCPVHGNWCEWSDWTECSEDCDGGSKTRSRECECEVPQFGGQECPGGADASTESISCNNLACPVDCVFSEWSNWSECPRTCGSSTQVRERSHIGPFNGGSECVGETRDMQQCNLFACDSCDSPFETVSCASPCERSCLARQNSTIVCSDTDVCRVGCQCPDGLFESNGDCVQECPCIYHDPNTDETIELSPGVEITNDCNTCTCSDGLLMCSEDTCDGKIIGQWSEWGSWSSCLGLCGEDATRARYRSCNNPLPSPSFEDGGSGCGGVMEDVEHEECDDLPPCPIDCGYTLWSDWGACSAPCSGGTHTRSRTSGNPPASNGGRYCTEDLSQTQACNVEACPGEKCEDIGRVYSECANACERECSDRHNFVTCIEEACKPGCRCPEGQLLQDDQCVPIMDCRCDLPDEYTKQQTSTKAPSSSLGLGFPIGSGPNGAFMPNDTVSFECNECTCLGGHFECTGIPCPYFGQWSEWTACTLECNGGVHERTRTCFNEAGDDYDCEGPTTEEKPCNENPCPQDCVYSEWGDWSNCSALCDGGISSRIRIINIPSANGGDECSDVTTQRQNCNVDPCSDECPAGMVKDDCANRCPSTCSDLHDDSSCSLDECLPGCHCPGDMVLQDGICVTPDSCRCIVDISVFGENLPDIPDDVTPVELPNDLLEFPPGVVLQKQCNTCTCDGGSFKCTEADCRVDCGLSEWSEWSECSRTCGKGIRTHTRTANNPSAQYGGLECEGELVETEECDDAPCLCGENEVWTNQATTCVPTCATMHDVIEVMIEEPFQACMCSPGYYRNQDGVCVLPTQCECLDEAGNVYEAGSLTPSEDKCETCLCVNGREECTSNCPEPPVCERGFTLVEEPGQCCPVCREVHEPGTCKMIEQVINVTNEQGCVAPDVPVTMCDGRCKSSTTILLHEPYIQYNCKCCRGTYGGEGETNAYDRITLTCPDGSTTHAIIARISKCECTEGCGNE